VVATAQFLLPSLLMPPAPPMVVLMLLLLRLQLDSCFSGWRCYHCTYARWHLRLMLLLLLALAPMSLDVCAPSRCC
jgi:hypothetical protein